MMDMIEEPTAEDLEWARSVVRIHPRRVREFQIQVERVTTKRNELERLERLFGGYVYDRPDGKSSMYFATKQDEVLRAASLLGTDLSADAVSTSQSPRERTLLRGLSPLSRPVRKDYPSTGTRPPREPGDRVSAEDRKIGANVAEAAMDEFLIAKVGTPYPGGTIDRIVLLYDSGVELWEAKNTTRGTPTGDDRLNPKQREMYESGNVKVYHHFGPGDYEVWVCESGVEKCVEKSA